MFFQGIFQLAVTIIFSDFKSSNVRIFSFSFSFLRKYFEHCIFIDSFFLKTGLWFIIQQVPRCKKNGGASKSPELKLINVLVKIQALLALSRWRQRPRSTRVATPLWLLYDPLGLWNWHYHDTAWTLYQHLAHN